MNEAPQAWATAQDEIDDENRRARKGVGPPVNQIRLEDFLSDDIPF
jgi:hypothetical protein